MNSKIKSNTCGLIWRLYFNHLKFKPFNNERIIACILIKYVTSKGENDTISNYQMMRVTFQAKFFFFIEILSFNSVLCKFEDFFEIIDTTNSEIKEKLVMSLNSQPKTFIRFTITTYKQYVYVEKIYKSFKGYVYNFFKDGFSIEENWLLQTGLNFGLPIRINTLINGCSFENQISTFPSSDRNLLLNKLIEIKFGQFDEKIMCFSFQGDNFVGFLNSIFLKNDPKLESAFKIVDSIACVFDIETRKVDYNDLLDVPKPHNGLIMCITMCFYKTKFNKAEDMIKNSVMINLIVKPSETTTQIECQTMNTCINEITNGLHDANIFYNNEKDLLFDFIRSVNSSCSFIIGYNSLSYDLPFIYESFARYVESKKLTSDYFVYKTNFFKATVNNDNSEIEMPIDKDSDDEYEVLGKLSDDQCSKSEHLIKPVGIIKNIERYNKIKFETKTMPSSMKMDKNANSDLNSFFFINFDSKYRYNSLPFTQCIDIMNGFVKLNVCVKENLCVSCQIVSHKNETLRVSLIESEIPQTAGSKKFWNNLCLIFTPKNFICIEMVNISKVVFEQEIFEIKTCQSEGDKFFYLDLVQCVLTKNRDFARFQPKIQSVDKYFDQQFLLLFPTKHETGQSFCDFWNPQTIEEYAHIVGYCCFDVRLTTILDVCILNKLATLEITGSFVSIPPGCFIDRPTGFLGSQLLIKSGLEDNLVYTNPSEFASYLMWNTIPINSNGKVKEFYIESFDTERNLSWIINKSDPIINEYETNTQPFDNTTNNDSSCFTLNQSNFNNTNQLLQLMKTRELMSETHKLWNKTKFEIVNKFKVKNINWHDLLKENIQFAQFHQEHLCFKKMYACEIKCCVIASQNFEIKSCFNVFFIHFIQSQVEIVTNFILFLLSYNPNVHLVISKDIVSFFNISKRIEIKLGINFLLEVGKKTNNLGFISFCSNKRENVNSEKNLIQKYEQKVKVEDINKNCLHLASAHVINNMPSVTPGGAIVVPVTTSICFSNDDKITQTIDYTSLYPSIMVRYCTFDRNCCPNSSLRYFSLKREFRSFNENDFYTVKIGSKSNGVYCEMFVRFSNEISHAYQIIKQLLILRVELKKLNPILSSVMKLYLNSAFGSSITKFYPNYNFFIGAAILGLEHVSLLRLFCFISYFNGVIVGGDTDSLHYQIEKKFENIWENFNQLKVNSKILKIELEAIWKLMIILKKKRYCGWYTMDSVSNSINSLNYKGRGLDSKSYCKFSSNILKSFIHNIISQFLFNVGKNTKFSTQTVIKSCIEFYCRQLDELILLKITILKISKQKEWMNLFLIEINTI